MKIKNYIGTAMAALLCAACNEMENMPTNQFTDNSFWTSPEKAQYVVNMAYSQMYNADRLWTDESLSDNLFDGRGNTDQRQIRKGMATPATGVFSSQWSDLYGGIKTCHLFLSKIDLVTDMDAAVKARMTAEIRFVRAFLYFRLTNLYGAIPFFTNDITLEEANSIGRTAHETVVEFIHQELDEIADQLPTNAQLANSERGKITKGAVAALQARVYLMDSDWDNVIRYCSLLMDQQSNYGTYDLFPDYRGLFSEANEYNQEVILDRAYVPTVMTWSEMVDMAPLSVGGRVSQRAPQQSLVDAYLMLSGKTISEPGSDYNPDYPYDNRDPRLTATIVYDNYHWSENVDDGSADRIIHIRPGSGSVDEYIGPGQNTTSTGYYVRKYYAPQASGDLASGLNLIIFRYADILLMYAEAKLEKGELDPEVWNRTIRPIRQRAGFTAPLALDFPDKSPDEMKRILRNERRCELALEGLRWYDIKRWKAGTEYLNGYAYGANFTGTPIQLDNRRFDESRDYLWAVPQSQINLNPNLLPNNPGYSN